MSKKSNWIRIGWLAAVILLCAVCVFAAVNESRTTFVYPPFKHTWGVVRATPAKLFMLVGNRTKFRRAAGARVRAS